MRNYINEYTNESGVTDSLNALSLTKPYLALLSDSGTIDWNTKSVDYNQVPLTIEFLSGGTLDIDKSNSQQSIIYMQFKRIVSDFPDSEWQTISTQGNPKKHIIVKAGDIIQFKGTNDTYSVGINYNYFSTKVNNVVTPIPVKVYGNIMSLIYGDNFVNQTFFPTGTTDNLYRIFHHLLGITDASNLILPATTLTRSCYSSMFEDCTSLTQAPVLPATTLAEYCYASMFQGCTSLTQAPVLNAITLAPSCYQSMFKGCTSLTTAPSSIGTSATTMVTSACTQMFRGCESLTTAPALPATTLAYSCYDNMFYGCTSLTQAPELPATTLATYCYYSMFAGCSNLNYVKCLATDISAPSCTYLWLDGVASTGTFVKDANTTWQYDIPSGWTVIDAN